MVREFEGKTENEAIALAMATLNLEQNELDIEIVDSKKRGLFKKGNVKIRVYLPDEAKESGDIDQLDDFEQQVVTFTTTVFETLPVIAEDLGVITPEVDALREENNFPGMKIAHFSFDIAKDGLINQHNAYLPHNYEPLCVAYTGTHDNDTTVGWYNSLPANYKDIVRRYLSCSDADVPYQLMRSVMASCAQFAIIPMQDVLLLDGSARMNLPGSCGEPNWCWRLEKEQLNKEAVERLSELTRNFARQSKLEDLRLFFKR
jgi:4-alpha-glucanotransferase